MLQSNEFLLKHYNAISLSKCVRLAFIMRCFAQKERARYAVGRLLTDRRVKRVKLKNQRLSHMSKCKPKHWLNIAFRIAIVSQRSSRRPAFYPA